MERGRLKFSADAIDFFSDEGEAGISASNRIRGVVLHDILARIDVPEDLERAVSEAVSNGEISSAEAVEIKELLARRLAEVDSYGWFAPNADKVLKEVDLVDDDGTICRPDRVTVNGGSVSIIDYKFGEHRRQYERQLRRYADIWRRMGYADVKAVLWYVQTGEIQEVV